MAKPVKLSAAFGLPPEDAIRYFRSKGYTFSWDWHDVRESTHARGFTVAKVTEMDVLTTIRAEVDRALAEGITVREFQKNLTPRLQALGWWGRKESLDLETGEIRKEQLGSPRRLETIYRSNLQSAYMAGRYKGMAANTAHRPYWMYRAIRDSRTRHDHLSLDGAIFKHDDPIWQNIFPPNGFGCRCTVRALTQRQIDNGDLKVSESKDYTEHWVSEDRNGNTFDRTSIKLPGMQRAFTTDRGWNGNPGAQAHTNMTTFALEKAINVYPHEASRAIGEIFGRDNILKTFTDEYGKWVHALDFEKTTGARYLIGALPEEAIIALAALEIMPESAILSVTDRQIMHGLRDAKVSGLSASVWHNLPAELAGAEAVLLDTTKKIPALLYVLPGVGGKKKVVIDVDYRIRERSVSGARRETAHTNMVITGRIITDVTVLKDPNYAVLWGGVK
ncbi:MAG: minor capsid protein [Burkholderiales bacterium]|jgi:SPP1 gp7 family putative phage head morphogenesis protein|nr:minor capsid protein [Burkholderiales bacterium]